MSAKTTKSTTIDLTNVKAKAKASSKTSKTVKTKKAAASKKMAKAHKKNTAEPLTDTQITADFAKWKKGASLQKLADARGVHRVTLWTAFKVTAVKGNEDLLHKLRMNGAGAAQGLKRLRDLGTKKTSKKAKAKKAK